MSGIPHHRAPPLPTYLIYVDGERALWQGGRLHCGYASKNAVGQADDRLFRWDKRSNVRQIYRHSDLPPEQNTVQNVSVLVRLGVCPPSKTNHGDKPIGKAVGDGFVQHIPDTQAALPPAELPPATPTPGTQKQWLRKTFCPCIRKMGCRKARREINVWDAA